MIGVYCADPPLEATSCAPSCGTGWIGDGYCDEVRRDPTLHPCAQFSVRPPPRSVLLAMNTIICVKFVRHISLALACASLLCLRQARERIGRRSSHGPPLCNGSRPTRARPAVDGMPPHTSSRWRRRATYRAAIWTAAIAINVVRRLD
jgi:hypothetical protein